MAYQNSVKIGISLPAKVLEQLDKLAELYGAARSEVIRLALIEYFQTSDLKEAQRLQSLSDKVNKQRLDKYLNSIDFDEINDEP